MMMAPKGFQHTLMIRKNLHKAHIINKSYLVQNCRRRKAVWTKAQLLPEGRSADGAVLSHRKSYIGKRIF